MPRGPVSIEVMEVTLGNVPSVSAYPGGRNPYHPGKGYAVKPLARYASLNGYLDLCRSVAIDPVPLMRGAGLDPAGLGLQDRWVPAAALAKVLEDSAAQSGYEDFGLRMAERLQFANLGPLSLVVREEPDVRKAMGILSRYQHMYNEVLRTRLDRGQRGSDYPHPPPTSVNPCADRQFIELAVAVTHRLLTGFLGARWRALAVCFTHGPPTKMGIPTASCSARPSISITNSPGSSSSPATSIPRRGCRIRASSHTHSRFWTHRDPGRRNPFCTGSGKRLNFCFPRAGVRPIWSPAA